MERKQPLRWASELLIGASILVASTAQAADVIRVAYAGSMGVVMDRFIGPAFAKANSVEFQGIGQGAYGLARQLEGRLLQADVFVPITPGPIHILREAGMIGPAVPVASTQMVVAYSPKSKFVLDFEAAARSQKNWYDVLQTVGLRFGRTDPATDPQGQNIIFTMLLAETFYKQPGLANRNSRRLSERTADFLRALVVVASGSRTGRRLVGLSERDTLAPSAVHRTTRRNQSEQPCNGSRMV
jgi:molybdate/tungstate transport system substrate-binding protein